MVIYSFGELNSYYIWCISQWMISYLDWFQDIYIIVLLQMMTGLCGGGGGVRPSKLRIHTSIQYMVIVYGQFKRFTLKYKTGKLGFSIISLNANCSKEQYKPRPFRRPQKYSYKRNTWKITRTITVTLKIRIRGRDDSFRRNIAHIK